MSDSLRLHESQLARPPCPSPTPGVHSDSRPSSQWCPPAISSFILSGVISPLISSSILGTYWPEEFLYQYPFILPLHTVHGVLKARILKWFAIPFSSGPHSFQISPPWPARLGLPHGHGILLRPVSKRVLPIKFFLEVFCFQVLNLSKNLILFEFIFLDDVRE